MLSYAAVVMILVAVWPAKFGGPFGMVMVSGTSMEPTLQNGDLVVVRAKPAYEQGDIVVYRVTLSDQTYRIVHRVVAVEAAQRLITRGDNRPTVDPFTPYSTEVDGRVIVRVPGIGGVMTALADWRVSGAAVALCVFLAVLFPGRRRAP